jgi:hypothetical protein
MAKSVAYTPIILARIFVGSQARARAHAKGSLQAERCLARNQPIQYQPARLDRYVRIGAAIVSSSDLGSVRVESYHSTNR